MWLSLIGGTEGPPREVGRPRRSARDVTLAIEAALEIVELRSAEFRLTSANAWSCLSRQRTTTSATLHAAHAPDEEAIREHAKQGGFPANRIAEVTLVIDPTTAES